jgi:hypothetical protein
MNSLEVPQIKCRQQHCIKLRKYIVEVRQFGNLSQRRATCCGIHDRNRSNQDQPRLAYTFEEVGKHLELFSGEELIVISTDDGPYAREISQHLIKAVIGVAAFAGLREGEIRGQWWEDDDGKVLNIRRSVWRSHLKYETKTHEDEEDPGVVPIIEPLRVVLDAIKPENASGWMFPNTIGGRWIWTTSLIV